MWLSEQTKTRMPMGDAEVGVTTITGDKLAVVTRGEQRDLTVFGPGGYVWRPASGERVVVLQGGPGGTERWVAGCQQGAAPVSMQPGEIYLYSSDGTSIYLRKNGSIELQGRVSITGELIVNGMPYRPCICGG